MKSKIRHAMKVNEISYLQHMAASKHREACYYRDAAAKARYYGWHNEAEVWRAVDCQNAAAKYAKRAMAERDLLPLA